MSSTIRNFVDSIFAPARLRFYVWASLASQILIVVTGAAVRLTGSGLGCPTWPTCTEESLVTVPEMGIHGVIEFANRLLTFVLAIIALLTFVTVKRLAVEQRRGLVWTSFSLGMGIVAQAVIGGISVLTQLTWWVVGLHFVVSGILIAIATILVWNFYGKSRGEATAVARALAWPSYLIGILTVLLGVVVTGAGPHAGDADTPRSGYDLELVEHLHSYPAYVLMGLVAISLLTLRKQASTIATRLHFWLFIGLAGQALLGVAQARLGVPPLLVAAHMLGASCLIALLSAALLSATPTRKQR